MKIIYLMIGLAISQLSFAHGDQHKKMNQQASFQQEEWGIGGTKNEVNRTIAISMGDDMKFKPEKKSISRLVKLYALKLKITESCYTKW